MVCQVDVPIGNGKSGRSRQTKRKTLSVRVPSGVDDGMTLRMSGMGGEPGEGPGAQPGDLYVDVSVTKDAYFNRDGMDIHVDMPISIAQVTLVFLLPASYPLNVLLFHFETGSLRRDGGRADVDRNAGGEGVPRDGSWG